MKEINKKMMIGEAVRLNSNAAEILIENGVHCIGCGGMSFETLEQGLKAHGFSSNEIDKIIKSINNPKRINISDGASENILNMLGKKNKFLRIRKDGNNFRLILEKSKKKSDVEIREKGIKVIFSKNDETKMKNIRVDYSEESRGFLLR